MLGQLDLPKEGILGWLPCLTWLMARYMRFAYPVRIEKHADTVVARFPDVPER